MNTKAPQALQANIQLNTKASQALQGDTLLPILTPQLSVNLACQVTPEAQAKARRLIQKKKKPDTTLKAQDSVIQQAISLLYSKGFHTKEIQVACIQRLIYNHINVILIAQTSFSKSLII